jgi:hypothetical protein
MPVLLDVIIFLNLIIVLTQNGQFFGCATTAFNGPYVPAALILNGSALCPHSSFLGFIGCLEQTEPL